MNKIIIPLLIAVLLALVVSGLNVSGQGISSLTAEKQHPVLGLQMEKQQINIFALGQEYSVSSGEVSRVWQNALQDAAQFYRLSIDYLKKIWTIFYVLFLK